MAQWLGVRVVLQRSLRCREAGREGCGRGNKVASVDVGLLNAMDFNASVRILQRTE